MPIPSHPFADYPRRDDDMRIVSSAIRAALEYSPLSHASHADTLSAAIARRMEKQFWTKVYVVRDEVHDILLTLETGSLVMIAGESGSGKSTAIHAVDHELSLRRDASPSPSGHARVILPCIVDVNQFAKVLRDEESTSKRLGFHIYEFFQKAIRSRDAWYGYRYEHYVSFEEFRETVRLDNPEPNDSLQWAHFGKQPRYRRLITKGLAEFTKSAHSDRLPMLLEFIRNDANCEPLIIIDNIDQAHLDNDVVSYCAQALSEIMQSSREWISGVIAVRPENADTIKHILDTVVPATVISLTPQEPFPEPLVDPVIDVTYRFLANRFAVLRETGTIELIRHNLTSQDPSDEEVGRFLDETLKLLKLVVYDVFRSDEQDEKLKRANREIMDSIQRWHNGSLRECGLSLARLASNILQDKTHLRRRSELLRDAKRPAAQSSESHRRALRRITQSLIYHHLIFWNAPTVSQGTPITPPNNVKVFDLVETAANPPIPLLRLRLLQYLQNKERGQARMGDTIRGFERLGVDVARLDKTLRELAVKRSKDGARLVRLDRQLDVGAPGLLPLDTDIQLLPAGRFLVTSLCVTTEYLFWSALQNPAAEKLATIPRNPDARQIAKDDFRAVIAAKFLEGYLLAKLCEEHPYLKALTTEWTVEHATERLRIYRELFRFTRGRWFLHHAINSLKRFIPEKHQSAYYTEARTILERVDARAKWLDAIVNADA